MRSPQKHRSSSFSKPLVRAAILAATGNGNKLRKHLSAPATRKLRMAKLAEAILEVHLFAGFPASIEAMFILHESRPGSRIGRLRPSRGAYQAGVSLMRKVYGRNYPKVLRALTRLSPDLASWIVNYGYGTVLSRRRLTLRERELVAIGVLAALGWERQLRSHIMGARALRIPASQVRSALSLARAYLPAHRQGFQNVMIQRLAGELKGKRA